MKPSRKGPAESVKTKNALDDAGADSFAERLRKSMAVASITAAELTRRIQEEIPEFSPGNISHYLAGRSVPRTRVLAAIIRALGENADELALARVPRSKAGSARSSANSVRSSTNSPTSTSTSATDLPALNLLDLGDGSAMLQINQKLSWSVALRILQALKGDDGPG